MLLLAARIVHSPMAPHARSVIGPAGVFMAIAVPVVLGACAPALDTMDLVYGRSGEAATVGAAAGRGRRKAVEFSSDNGYELISVGAIYERREAPSRQTYTEVATRSVAADAATTGENASAWAPLALLARAKLDWKDADRATFALRHGANEPGEPKRIADGVGELPASAVAGRANGVSGMAAALAPAGPAGAAAMPASSEIAAPASEPKAGPAALSRPPRIMVHLASYRTAEKARKGWDETREDNRDLLGGLAVELVKIDLGVGIGEFFRVLAGAFTSEEKARTLCTRLKARGAFCALVFN